MTKTKSIYKLVLVALVAAIALCAVMLIGCNKDSAPEAERGERYYLYNENSKEFDYGESIRIDGDKCTVYIKGEDGLKDLAIDGTVTYDDDGVIKGNCGMIVTKLSEFMSQDGLDEMYEELGVSKLDIEFTANIKVEFTATKRANFLEVTHQSLTIRGFTGLLSMLNGTQSSSGREVYCKKGETPDYSVEFTIDFNGGTYNGNSIATFRTDKDGMYDLSTIKGERDGYVLYTFAPYSDFTGYTFNGKHRFYENGTTIYAHWKEEIVITLDINSTEYKVDGDTVIRTGKGMTAPTPKIVPIVANPTTRFKAWYNGTTVCLVPTYYNGNYFLESTTVKAEWYSASEVESYNNSLGTMFDDADFVIHFKPKDFSVAHIGWHGGSFIHFALYGVKDGQKDTLLGENTGSFNTTDKTGEIFKIKGVDRTYSGDVYLEILDNGKVVANFVIPKSELGVPGNQYKTHIFLDENDLSTYRTRW